MTRPTEWIETIDYGKDEMNLAEYPVSKLGKGDNRDKIEYHGRKTLKTGQVIEQKWTVQGAVGLPSEFGERVLVALMALTAQSKFEDRRVEFSIYRILKMMGCSTSHRNCTSVIQALQQLTGLLITQQNAFWDHKEKGYKEDGEVFHVIESAYWRYGKKYISESLEEKLGEARACITWSEEMWESFKAGYIKNLDLTFFFALKNPTARRLYRFLDKRMAYQDEYQIDIFALSGNLGMARYDFPSQLKKKLKPALEELVEGGFLGTYEFVKHKKYTRVRFLKGKPFTQLPLWEVATPEKHPPPPPSPEEELWTKVLSELQPQLNQASFDAYLRDSALLSLNDGVATIRTGHGKDWIENRLGRQIRMALSFYGKVEVQELVFIENAPL